MQTKVCSKCKKELPLTNQYFEYIKTGKDGFRGQCKKCRGIREKQYHEENRERLTKYRKQYNEPKKEIHKLYYESRKEDIAILHRKYNEIHKEALAKYSKQYAKEHSEGVRIRNNKHRSKRRLLISTLTNEQWTSIKQHFNNRCAYCGQELPLAQEHFIAVAKNGEYTNNNIVPSCKSCNSSKGAKLFNEWYPKYRYYSKKREKIILKFLNYKGNTQQLKII